MGCAQLQKKVKVKPFGNNQIHHQNGSSNPNRAFHLVLKTDILCNTKQQKLRFDVGKKIRRGITLDIYLVLPPFLIDTTSFAKAKSKV